jgi:hypothetical protein
MRRTKIFTPQTLTHFPNRLGFLCLIMLIRVLTYGVRTEDMDIKAPNKNRLVGLQHTHTHIHHVDQSGCCGCCCTAIQEAQGAKCHVTATAAAVGSHCHCGSIDLAPSRYHVAFWTHIIIVHSHSRRTVVVVCVGEYHHVPFDATAAAAITTIQRGQRCRQGTQ